MFFNLRQMICWHRWKLADVTRWTNGRTHREYICDKCLASKITKHK